MDARRPAKALRVFFAIWPDDSARAALGDLACELARAAGGRAPAQANLHVTLAFVGEVAPARVPALEAIGRAAAAAATPFTLALDRLGSFRDRGIAWIGATAVPPELTRLAESLALGLAAQGFPVERRAFAAHLTLARRCARPPAGPGDAHIAWPVLRLSLVESVPGRSGPTYRDIASWPFARGETPPA
jgi:2'-5' RNA ligase